jgi:hypothetical protein
MGDGNITLNWIIITYIISAYFECSDHLAPFYFRKSGLHYVMTFSGLFLHFSQLSITYTKGNNYYTS